MSNITRKEFSGLFSMHQRLCNLTLDWRDRAKSSIPEAPCGKEHAKALITILTICYRALSGVAVLCQEGLSSESIALVRKIFEGYMYAKYIRLDPENRAALFNILPAVSSVVRDQRLWLLSGEPANSLYYKPGRDNDYSRVIENLIQMVGKCRNDPKPTFKCLERVAKKYADIKAVIDNISKNPEKAKVQGNLNPTYEIEYRSLCEFAHGTGANIAAVTLSTKAATHFLDIKSDAFIPQGIIMGSKYFCWLLLDIAHGFGIPLGVELHKTIVEPFLEEIDGLAENSGIRFPVGEA